MKKPFLIVYRVDTHSRGHYKCSLEEHGFFKGTPQAGFLVTQTLTRLAVLPRAVDSVAPVQELVIDTKNMAITSLFLG